jgi:hypothetical protein
MQQVIRVTPPNVTEIMGTVLFNNLVEVPASLSVWIVPTGMQLDDDMIVLGTPVRGLTLPPGAGEPYVAHALSGMVLRAGYTVVVLTTQPVNTVANGWIHRGSGPQVHEMPVLQGHNLPQQRRAGTMTIVTNPSGIPGALKNNP